MYIFSHTHVCGCMENVFIDFSANILALKPHSVARQITAERERGDSLGLSTQFTDPG